jgi:protein ImuA
LSLGALHEIAPATPAHIAAASGFGLAMAARTGRRKAIVLIQTDFAGHEAGLPYGPGLNLFGLDMRRLVVARVARAADALFIMEDALRCRGVACALCELTGAGEAADITATRRLSLAAREGGGIGFLLRHRASRSPSAAATRWDIAAATGARDRYGGLGATVFLLSLVKNRRGPCGRWTLEWNHHDRIFTAPHSLGLAATPADRPARAGFARAG